MSRDEAPADDDAKGNSQSQGPGAGLAPLGRATIGLPPACGGRMLMRAENAAAESASVVACSSGDAS